MSFRLSFASLWIACLFLLSACGSARVLRDQDYHYSLNAYRAGAPDEALNSFPKKESGGFITSVEKSWLQFWSGSSQVGDLQRQSDSLEERRFISLHREAGTFLFQESEEGYVPSEPEVVVLHLMSAMSYMKLERWTAAEVEARRAAFYLQSYAPGDEGVFDDPALRIWLASVWAALGLWNEAQVDLRKAAVMTKDPTLARWAESQAPAQLSLVFDGVAPHFRWNNSSATPEFGPGSPAPQGRSLSFSTHPWFDRHLKRNTVLRDTMVKSNYMAQFLGVKAENNLGRGAGKVSAVTVGVIGVGVGVAFAIAAAAYVGGEAGAYLAGGGIALAGYTYKAVTDWDRRFQQRIDDEEQATFESMRTYRLVRFLPEWISLEFKAASGNLHSRSATIAAPKSQTRVIFINDF